MADVGVRLTGGGEDWVPGDPVYPDQAPDAPNDALRVTCQRCRTSWGADVDDALRCPTCDDPELRANAQRIVELGQPGRGRVDSRPVGRPIGAQVVAT